MNKKEFAKEMREDLAIYAEEVNEHRALPAIEDGLRPSARFLLYCLYKDGHLSNKKYVKCAAPIGQTLARYYVHGDQALYGVLTNLSQDWKNNASLIDFHGGLGTPDAPNDSASLRYTECRLSQYGEALIADLNYNTAEWEDNYLNTEKVPKRFNSSFPNILVNPTIGIGWSMACNWLPHNLKNVFQAIQDRIDGKEVSLTPSFPSGGVIINAGDLPTIYKNGRGSVVVRGVYSIVSRQTIFTELPYRVGPVKIIEQLKELGIKAQDESTMDGIRLVIDSTDIDLLFDKTSLQESYNMNMTGLINGKPKLFCLNEILDFYIAQQHKRLIDKSQYFIDDLAHKILIQEGIVAALDNIDKVIEIIRGSETQNEALSLLCEFLIINAEQAKAILDIKLGRLTKLDINAVKDLIKKYQEEIKEWEELNTSPEKRIENWQQEIKKYNTSPSLTKLENLMSALAAQDTGKPYIAITNFTRIFLTTKEPKLKDGEEVLYQELPENLLSTLVIEGTHYNKDYLLQMASARGKTLKSKTKISELVWE